MNTNPIEEFDFSDLDPGMEERSMLEGIDMSFYVHSKGKDSGPVSESEVRAMLASGKLSPNDLAIPYGGQQWLPLGEMFREAVRELTAFITPIEYRTLKIRWAAGYFNPGAVLTHIIPKWRAEQRNK